MTKLSDFTHALARSQAVMVLFAINTGLRTRDIFNLQWMEVDIEQTPEEDREEK